MIDSIAQWLLFLLWNLPLFFLGFFVLSALIAWPFSIIYATFGIIVFPFLDNKKLKKMYIERQVPDLNFRVSPLNIHPWEPWGRFPKNKVWGINGMVIVFLFLIAVWLVLLFFVHFLMAHVFGYPPAQQASATTELMLGLLLPPYSDDATMAIRLFALGLVPIIVFNVAAPSFTKKVGRFIWDELRYDWFKSFFAHKNYKQWIDFGEDYMLLHLPEDTTFKRGEYPAYRRQKVWGLKRDLFDPFSSRKYSEEEDKFRLYSSFRWKVLDEGRGVSRPYHYLIDYQVYPCDISNWNEEELERKTKALLYHLDYGKALDIYLQAGLEKGYIEEITNEQGEPLLRRTNAPK